jgi:hypothetical protein
MRYRLLPLRKTSAVFLSRQSRIIHGQSLVNPKLRIKLPFLHRSLASNRIQSRRQAMPGLGLDVAAGHAALLQILLVIVLSGEEGYRGDDLRNDGFRVAPGLLQRFLRGLRRGLLFG